MLLTSIFASLRIVSSPSPPSMPTEFPVARAAALTAPVPPKDQVDPETSILVMASVEFAL